MPTALDGYLLSEFEKRHVLWVIGVLIAARLLSTGLTLAFSALGKRLSPRSRMAALRLTPLIRLLIAALTVGLIIPLIIEPTTENVFAVLASASFALAFALKDYGSCLVGALVTVIEHPYQPGDWIEIGGTYGEVRAIGLRAVRLVTADDTEVIIPHKKLWDTSIHNATSGNGHVLCVADFYLEAEHDGGLVRTTLKEAAAASPYLFSEGPVKVTAAEVPWGTHYRLKAYAKDSREQHDFTTDLTLRVKAALMARGVKPAIAPYAEAAEAGRH